MPETVKVDPSASLGASFADALATKDFDQIRDLLHPESISVALPRASSGRRAIPTR